MAQRERIARLLASGFEPQLVAKITNIPPTYLSQLLRESEFQAQVKYLSLGGDLEEAPATHVAQEEAEVASLKDSLKAAEQLALMTIHERLPLMDDRNLISAFQSLTARRDSMAKTEAMGKALKAVGANGGIPTVVINLPNIVVPELNLSSQREVVGFGDRSTVPMGRDQLTALIEGELSHEQLST